jgi:hypothetical protein
VGTADAIDKVSGLFKGAVNLDDSAAPAEFLMVNASGASAIKDLSTTLLTADGEAWSLEDTTKVTLSIQGPNKLEPTGFDVYVGDSEGMYTKYSFDENYTMTDDGGVEMTALEVATAEMSTGRDINGDKVKGVKVLEKLDTVGGMYKVQLDGDVTHTAIAVGHGQQQGDHQQIFHHHVQRQRHTCHRPQGQQDDGETHKATVRAGHAHGHHAAVAQAVPLYLARPHQGQTHHQQGAERIGQQVLAVQNFGHAALRQGIE